MKQGKVYKFLALLVTAAALLCAACDSGGDDGDTPPPRVSIGSEADLRKIGGDPAFPLNGIYELTDDITLSNWTPIGGAQPFTGTFDGGGHAITITGFNPAGTSMTLPDNWQDWLGVTSAAAIGLFGHTKNADIKNLNITANFSGALTIAAANQLHSIGIAAGYAVNTTFTSVHVSGGNTFTVTTGGSLFWGGIAGMFYDGGRISGCSSGLGISATAAGTVLMGGIAGMGSASIEGCSATGDVEGLCSGTQGMAIGGLTGNAGGGVKNSYATGNVTARYQGTGGGEVRAGGLVGHFEGLPIENSYAAGTVSSKNENADAGAEIIAGGLVGQAEKSDDGVVPVIKKSYAAGSVSATGGVGHAWAGGMVGYAHNGVDITDSYATGAVSATATGSNGSFAGGILGSAYNGSPVITRTYAKGNVSASGSDSDAGGIVGNSYPPSAVSASAALSGSVSAASGAWRIASGGTLTNNIANSDMTGGTFSDKTANGRDGADVTLPPAQNAYTGWDFTNTWEMSGGYPVLQWQ